MNVLEDPNGLAELQKLGARSVPVLSRGDKFTFGQSTKQIVDFLGLTEKSGPELTTDELVVRLANVGAAVKRTFNAVDQDIEWATVGDRIVLLQARPYVERRR